MNRIELLLQLMAITFVTAIEHEDVNIIDNPHIRQKRFVYYPGSVLQIAAGMAIPAEVKHRIIYTNFGIMINYDLPTNLSSLLPVTIVEELRGSKSWEQMSTDLFQRLGWNLNCWRKLEEWTDENRKLNNSLVYEFATLILREREINKQFRTQDLQDVSPCPLLVGW